MGRRIILLFSFFIFAGITVGQNPVSFTQVDTKSYQFYLSGNWDSVIHYCKLGLENNIDFFYLRSRLGTAYYNKEDYTKAIKEFRASLNFNSADTYSRQMLYYSYLFSGRESEARCEGGLLDSITQSLISYKKINPLSSISFEGSGGINRNISANEKADLLSGSDTYAQSDLSGNMILGQLVMKHDIGKRITVEQGLMYLNENKRRVIQNVLQKPGGTLITTWDTIYYVPPPPVGGHFNHDTIITHSLFLTPFDTVASQNYILKQLDYFLNCRIYLGKGYNLTPSFHLLNVKYSNLSAQFENKYINTIDTQFVHTQIVVPNPFPPPPLVIKDTMFVNYRPGLLNSYQYHYGIDDTAFYNFALGVSLEKHFCDLKLSAFSSWSNLNGRKQTAGGISITWYPFGNLNLYGNLNSSVCVQDKDKPVYVNYLVIGTKLMHGIWLEAGRTFGRVLNFCEKDLEIVHNSPDAINWQYNATFYLIFNKFDIILNYQLQEKETYYCSYYNQKDYNILNFTYYNNLITGGIKWKF